MIREKSWNRIHGFKVEMASLLTKVLKVPLFGALSATPPSAHVRPWPWPPFDPRFRCGRLHDLVGSLPKPSVKTFPSLFVKKLDQILEIKLSGNVARCKALALVSKGFIGQFTGLWPSPKQMDTWIAGNWMPLIRGRLYHYFCGKGFYTFSFEFEEDRDLIFHILWIWKNVSKLVNPIFWSRKWYSLGCSSLGSSPPSFVALLGRWYACMHWIFLREIH